MDEEIGDGEIVYVSDLYSKWQEIGRIIQNYAKMSSVWNEFKPPENSQQVVSLRFLRRKLQ
jgi:hypothetical protein